MNGSMKYDYDTEEGEVFKLLILYEYVPYHPADWNGPAEGGGCEEIECKVIGYQKYDEDGNLTIDWPVLTPEREKELNDNFYKILDANQRLYEILQEACDAEAESVGEDYD